MYVQITPLASDTVRHASTRFSRIFIGVGTIEYIERGGGSCFVRDVSLKWLAVHTVLAEMLNPNCRLAESISTLYDVKEITIDENHFRWSLWCD
jgi:hypothetical protein